MSDTPVTTERLQRDMLMRRSGEERLKMACSMLTAARALVHASVLARNPLASPTLIRRMLFVRFHEQDFDAPAREKIMTALGLNGE